MKFSAALALLAVPVAVADLPAGFVPQCCIDVPTPDNFDWHNQFNVAGWSSPECFSLGTNCKTYDQLCEDLNTNPALDGFVCDDGFNCCVDDEGTIRIIGDIPWTCAILIGDFTSLMTGNTGPVSGIGGYFCGKQNQCKSGIACGDPHIQTWSGDWYDFHGECDLKFMEEKEFGQGLGMTIHIRTKARYEYSYIESAALKIGDDVLEVGSYGNYFINGVHNADLEGFKMGGLYEISYEVSQDKKNHVFNVLTGNGDEDRQEAIQLKAFKDLVAVKMVNAYEQTFGKSVGMMGSYEHGFKLSRNGKDIIEDPIEFGMEWQVRADEPKLFQVVDRSPQLPAEKCIMPSKNAAAQRRRLGETVPLEAAVAACEAVDHVHPELCVYDVMATGDLEIAHAGVF